MSFGTDTVQRTNHIGAEVLRSVCHAITSTFTGKTAGNHRISTVHIGKGALVVRIRTDSCHADNIRLAIVRLVSNVNTAHFITYKSMRTDLNTSRTGIRICTDSDTAGHFIRIFRQRISATKKSGFIKIIRRKAQAPFLFTAAVQDLRILSDSDTRQIQPIRRN